MSKLYFNITDPSDYTDNRFGRFLQSMCAVAKNDCILVFHNHVCVIRYDGKSEVIGDYNLKFYAITNKPEQENYIDVKEDTEVEINVDCHKWLGYRLMKQFRIFYPEFKDKDFPVEQMKMWFEGDAYSYVYLDEDDSDELKGEDTNG